MEDALLEIAGSIDNLSKVLSPHWWIPENIIAFAALIIGCISLVISFWNSSATKETAKATEQSVKKNFMPVIESIGFSHSYISSTGENFYMLKIRNSGLGIANNLHIYLDNTLVEGPLTLPKGRGTEVKIPDSRMIQAVNPEEFRMSYDDIFGTTFVSYCRLRRDGGEFQIRGWSFHELLVGNELKH